MTIDKIKHYLSPVIFAHIASLNAEQLNTQKQALIKHIEYLKVHDISFYHENKTKIEAEFNFINYRLS